MIRCFEIEMHVNVIVAVACRALYLLANNQTVNRTESKNFLRKKMRINGTRRHLIRVLTENEISSLQESGPTRNGIIFKGLML